MENHAHDIYDLFHAIHKTAIKKATFFHWDEMAAIVRGAHVASLRFVQGDTEASESSKKPGKRKGDAKASEPSEKLKSRKQKGDAEASEPSKKSRWIAAAGERPIMGPDVLVSNLWQVRDFWEWLFPGYHDCPADRACPQSVEHYLA